MLQLLLPATLWQAKLDRAYMGIHIYIWATNTENHGFSKFTWSTPHIKHSVAIETVYVYMYAHICYIYFCQPPCGKQK